MAPEPDTPTGQTPSGQTPSSQAAGGQSQEVRGEEVAERARRQSWKLPAFATARAHLFNLDNDSFARIGGPDDPSIVAGYTVELDEQEVRQVIESVEEPVLQEQQADCFIPHHAVVFYDEQEAIVGELTICFMCQNAKVRPEVPDSNFNLTRLKSLLRGHGMPMFTTPTEATALRQKLQAQPHEHPSPR